jgi:tetratricopeptide (TPR) repeat protein
LLEEQPMSVSHDFVQQTMEGGDLPKAEDMARLLVQENPTDANAYLLLGRILGMQGKYEDTAKALRESIQLDEKNPDAWRLLGLTSEFLAQYEEAIQSFKKALTLGQNQSQLHYYLGRIYANYAYRQRDANQARRHLHKSIEAERPPREAFLELAALEQPQRAVYVLQNALKRFPQEFEFYERLTALYLGSLNDTVGALATVTSAAEKEVMTDQLRFSAAVAHIRLGEHAQARQFLQDIETDNTEIDRFLRCMQTVTLIEQSIYEAAEPLVRSVIVEDLTNRLGFAAHCLLICCLMRQSRNHEAERVLAEVPENQSLYPLLLTGYPLGDYDLDLYLMEDLDGLAAKSTDRIVIGKARGLRALYKYSSRNDQADSALTGLIRDDLSFALGVFPDNMIYHQHLGYVLEELGDWREAIRQYLAAQFNSDVDLGINLHFLERVYQNKGEFTQLLNEIDQIIDSTYLGRERFIEYFLGQMVEFLYSKQEYKLVVRAAKQFSYQDFLDAGVLFELAYSYIETNDRKRGKICYETYLKNRGENSAVCNNLGLIYEKDGDYNEAARLFQKAIEIDKEDEIASRNLRRVQDVIQQILEQRRAAEKAVDLYMQEPTNIKRALARLYEERSSDELILCRMSRLASLLNLPEGEASQHLESFIGKRYLERVAGHVLQFDGEVLKASTILIPHFERELAIANHDEFVGRLTLEISAENLERKYGYDQSLLNRLSVVTSPELIVFLRRDMREAVFSLATQSYKATLILCGSIVEAILLDRLQTRRDSAIRSLENVFAKANKRMTADDKDIERWTLERLLDVAREENIISENLYHWGHGIRGFRNLVHPGVEQRKKIDVSRDGAEIAWQVVKHLLNELS